MTINAGDNIRYIGPVKNCLIRGSVYIANPYPTAQGFFVNCKEGPHHVWDGEWQVMKGESPLEQAVIDYIKTELRT